MFLCFIKYNYVYNVTVKINILFDTNIYVLYKAIECGFRFHTSIYLTKINLETFTAVFWLLILRSNNNISFQQFT